MKPENEELGGRDFCGRDLRDGGRYGDLGARGLETVTLELEAETLKTETLEMET